MHYNCPSVTVWGTYKDDPAFNNIVRRNLIWRPVDAGVQATGETTIENNVIVGALSRGLSIRGRDGDGKMQYMRIVNNTIYMADGDAAVSLYKWDAGSGGTGLLFANNAVFQDTSTKVAVKGELGLDNGTFSGNLIYGQVQAQFLPVSIAGLTLANPPEQQFLNVSIYPGKMNFYPKPGSQLLDAADPLYGPWDDFNLQTRPMGTGYNVGAYEVGPAANPGWQLTLGGFKDMNAVPPGPRPILSVSPVDGISLSAWPGQFTLPCSRTYTLTNTGTAALPWTAAVGVTWADLSSTGATLNPGDSTTVTVSLNDGINNLPGGRYNVPVRFTNTLSGDGNKAVPIALTVLSPGRLAVSPDTGISGWKMIGGYDTPYCLYTVSNAGDLPLDWTVSADQPWVSFMDTNSTPISGGTLQPQASQDMYAYVDWLTTDEMTVGTYTATITFDASASGGNILTRDVLGAADLAGRLQLRRGRGRDGPDDHDRQLRDQLYGHDLQLDLRPEHGRLRGCHRPAADDR